jgi:copper(I)-binding protein
MMRTLAILSVLSCFLVAAFGEKAFSQSAERIVVTDPWAPPSLDGASVGTAFVTLTNSDNTPITLETLTSDIAETVELHDHVMDNGRMMMRRVEPMVIPAKGSIAMKPGGLHLMLIGLKRPLKDAETLTVTATPKNTAPFTISFPVSQARLIAALKSRSNSGHAH